MALINKVIAQDELELSLECRQLAELVLDIYLKKVEDKNSIEIKNYCEKD